VKSAGGTVGHHVRVASDRVCDADVVEELVFGLLHEGLSGT
jgi:hypothetical protein